MEAKILYEILVREIGRQLERLRVSLEWAFMIITTSRIWDLSKIGGKLVQLINQSIWPWGFVLFKLRGAVLRFCIVRGA